MKFKKDTGLAGTDMIIAIITIIIFSTFILSLMINNSIENMKIAKETMAMIYITQIFENIGIADYDTVSEKNTDNFIPEEALNNYKVDITIEDDFEEIEEQQDIIKKITLSLSYNVGNKTYTSSMERYKIKE